MRQWRFVTNKRKINILICTTYKAHTAKAFAALATSTAGDFAGLPGTSNKFPDFVRLRLRLLTRPRVLSDASLRFSSDMPLTLKSSKSMRPPPRPFAAAAAGAMLLITALRFSVSGAMKKRAQNSFSSMISCASSRRTSITCFAAL